MSSEMNVPRDLRYPCLVTVLAILLFLPELFFVGLLPRMAEMMSELGAALPTLSRILVASPLITLLFFVGLMISTIFFAWCQRKGAILASLSLLMQGIALGVHALACFLPWVQVVNAMASE
jgi:type II secretory pathway component PulF